MRSPTALSTLQQIYSILFHMLMGKPLAIANVGRGTDPLSHLQRSLYALATILAEETSALVPPYVSTTPFSPFFFTLDPSFKIRDYSETALYHMRVRRGSYDGQDFEVLLSPTCQSAWRSFTRQIKQHPQTLPITTLGLAIGPDQVLNCYALLSKFGASGSYLLCCVGLPMVATPAEKPSGAVGTGSEGCGLYLSQAVANYLLTHLDQPFPKVSTLAMHFGVSHQVLQRGFRMVYSCSMYQFYQESRLQKAYVLVVQGQLPLKLIAYQCGFEMYLNFYKAFKKRFGLSPRALRATYEHQQS